MTRTAVTRTLSIPVDSLLAEGRWMRKLAKELIHDEHLADDLAQTTMARALDTDVPPGVSLRAWLGTVLRNSWIDGRRREERRRRREVAVAMPERGAVPAGELVEKAELQRHVLEAVLRLEERYRTAILMRYFEDRSPPQIAKRLGVPLGTIKTRLHRGLNQLRTSLDDLHDGERRTWVGALVALAYSRPEWVLCASSLTMKSKTIAVAALVLLIGFVTWPLWGAAAAAEDLVEEASPIEVAGSEGGEPTPAGGSAGAVSRRAVPDTDTPPPSTSQAVQFRGVVLDALARAVAGAQIILRAQSGAARPTDERGPVRTEEDGSFQLPVPDRPCRIDIVDPGRIVVLASQIGPTTHRGSEPVTIVAPALSIGVRVEDVDGRPLAGVDVSCVLPAGFRSGFPAALDHAADPVWRGRTNADGGLDGWRIGRVKGAVIQMRKLGFLPVRVPQPEEEEIRIVLKRPVSDGTTISGEVTSAAGHLVPGARVAMGNAETETGADGKFALVVTNAGSGRRLVAMKRGHMATEHEVSEEEMPGGGRVPTFLHLQLGLPPMEIGGRVVDSAGKAVAGAKVFLADVTVFGRMAVAVEAFLATNNDKLWYHVVSDDSGRFRITGLLNRSYTLTALLSRPQLQADAGPFHAGIQNATIVLPTERLYARVAGTVVTSDGSPVSGARVYASSPTLFIQRSPTSSTSYDDDDGPRTVTDENGRFDLGALAKSRVYVGFASDEIMTHDIELEKLGDRNPGDLRIEVSLRMHFRLELGDVGFADSFSVLNSEGERLSVSQLKGASRITFSTPRIRSGKTDVLAVTDRARALVLFKDRKEVLRIPLSLSPRRINVIRP